MREGKSRKAKVKKVSRLPFSFFLFPFLLVCSPIYAQNAGKGNRLAYLDELDPYYPSRTSPKLITPQWVGEEGVDAVVILAIDDMREHKKYETFLRPILDRLKKIDGRAPVSIMTCKIDPQEPHLQTWLKEGLSIECHTYDHPCPFFKLGFDKSKETYDKCVDLMHQIPNNKPVAFRMPCCDSLNTPSPRHWAEIFNKITPAPPAGEGGVRGKGGNFLQIDSSVFNVFTSADPELPRELVLDEKGLERFKRYLPADRTFVNTIENYPYPYVIGRLCWEFPCVTPSDWSAQHLQKSNNPKTVEDWKAVLDCTVIKQGVFCLVFHPHGWIKSEQVVDFIDHAVAKHGKKVKFLNFKEAQERLDRSLFDGRSLRNLRTTPNTRVQVVGSELWQTVNIAQWQPRYPSWTRTWTNTWSKTSPIRWITEIRKADFVRERKNFDDSRTYDPFERHILHPASGQGITILKASDGHKLSIEYPLEKQKAQPIAAPFSMPPGAVLSDAVGKDAGLRFVDLGGDGKLDIIFSNEKEYGIYLFENMEKGWSKKIMAGKRREPGVSGPGELPMISRNGTNNGFWVHSGHLWWSNEDTVNLRDHVDRRSIKELLGR